MATRDRSDRVRRRRFCLTLNNPTTVECVQWNTVLSIGNDAEHATDLTFFVVQTEKGDGTDTTPVGTVHYQAYCEFSKKTEWSTLKKIFGDRIHITNSRGNAKSNIAYCTKEDTRYTGGAVCIKGSWGTAKRGGSMLMAAMEIKAGADMEEIDDKYPALVMMYGNKVEGYIARSKGHRHTKPKVTILYGLTGCGKSQYCLKVFGTKAYWVSSPAGAQVWWGHYMGQKVCIFDDFHDKWFALTDMIRLLDSTPYQVAPKGGQVPFTSELLIFTSNVDPKDWYSNYGQKPEEKKEHRDALERRIQDFAVIIDCSKEMVTNFFGSRERRIRKMRTETFKFRDDFGVNFSTAGVGDMSQGNGFNY